MKNYTKKFIIAIDPSGNYHEGKGTSGLCVYNAADDCIIRCEDISAAAYASLEEYWSAHLKLLYSLVEKYGLENVAIVIEDYMLYASKAKEQTNSRMETPQIIGVLKHYCWSQYIPYTMQPASEVKRRWENETLQYKKYILKDGRGFRLPNKSGVISRHCLDAVRHAVHYATFKNNKAPQNSRI